MLRVSLLLALIALPALAAEPAAEQRLRHLLDHDCGSCHGMTRKGGLGLPLTAESLVGRSDDDLAYVILNGVPGTPMPPWAPLLTAGEVDWIIRELRGRP
ncbi:MAG: cytochrome c [Alphaproteobacteria bacterium]|nr:cytochrome c [Alphaproteobacteria bacterium]